ncbi:hypothetical protein [Methylobacter sp. BlB1]|uniref:hypothetical protein n=1 Tax=Methylobacter sp. BlB1 TaxID=2785914 RepID=UPI001895E894|nr:hypothetical protein [Methylobacter sp. BlB1]MBF6650952.1 hypothetical protein [Methylobacter sp. BlB1]
MSNIPEPLKSILNDYCHVEWAEEMNELPNDLLKDDWAYDASLFKSQLRDAINNINFSVEDYESVTGEDFDSEEDLIERLKDIWNIAFQVEDPYRVV